MEGICNQSALFNSTHSIISMHEAWYPTPHLTPRFVDCIQKQLWRKTQENLVSKSTVVLGWIFEWGYNTWKCSSRIHFYVHIWSLCT